MLKHRLLAGDFDRRSREDGSLQEEVALEPSDKRKSCSMRLRIRTRLEFMILGLMAARFWWLRLASRFVVIVGHGCLRPWEPKRAFNP